MQIFSDKEKWFTPSENNLIAVRIVDFNLWNVQKIKDIILKLSNYVWKCILMEWEKEAISRSEALRDRSW